MSEDWALTGAEMMDVNGKSTSEGCCEEPLADGFSRTLQLTCLCRRAMGQQVLKRWPSIGKVVESCGSLDRDNFERSNTLLGKDGVGNVKDIGVKEGEGVTHTDKVHPVDEGHCIELLEEGRLGSIGLGALVDQSGGLDL